MKQCNFCGKELVREPYPIIWQCNMLILQCKEHKNAIIYHSDTHGEIFAASISGDIYFADFIFDIGKSRIFNHSDTYYGCKLLLTIDGQINPDKDLDDYVKKLLVFS